MIFSFRRRLIIKIIGSLYLFCGLGLTELSAEDANDVLQISEICWTNGINPETKTPMEIYREIAPKSPVYLWMKIRGGKRALEALSKNGKLPIRHKWFSYIGTRPYFDSTKEPTDTIELTVGKRETLSELNAQLDNQGFFEWRVWSGKENARTGWWRVDVVYADNEPVFCGKDPCTYNILVKD
ncbi:MAG: hypothetical protein BWK79_08705 [Beggiatoa sp. IS2]|nr:MAG: hypothetical protein BWK79_08705 [Beggiatoa sp. IS2]